MPERNNDLQKGSISNNAPSRSMPQNAIQKPGQRPSQNVGSRPVMNKQGQVPPQTMSSNSVAKTENVKAEPSKAEIARKKKLEAKAKELQNKYNKQRKINSKVIGKKSPVKIILGVIFNVVCTFLIFMSVTFCFASINSSVQHVCPNFAGFSNMQVVSGSMVASGFNIGDNVVVRSVNTHTLRGAHTDSNGEYQEYGDIIAFYRDVSTLSQFSTSSRVVDPDLIGNREYSLSVPQLFGFVNEDMKEAAIRGCEIVFHHVITVYEDADGVRWFATKGSSNDSWDVGLYVKETLVVGVYDGGAFTSVVSGAITLVASSGGVLLLLIPIVILAFFVIMQCLRDVQYAKLEYDVVEEKRKITDEICVKNNIGYRMNTQTKYKVLVQASDKDRAEYITLLWKRGEVPEGIRKYVFRKQIMLKPVEKLLKVNRKCQQMFKDGVDPLKIAEYYTKEKEKIEREQLIIQRYIRKRHKHYDELELENLLKEQEEKDKKGKQKEENLNPIEIEEPEVQEESVALPDTTESEQTKQTKQTKKTEQTKRKQSKSSEQPKKSKKGSIKSQK